MKIGTRVRYLGGSTWSTDVQPDGKNYDILIPGNFYTVTEVCGDFIKVNVTNPNRKTCLWHYINHFKSIKDDFYEELLGSIYE